MGGDEFGRRATVTEWEKALLLSKGRGVGYLQIQCVFAVPF